MKRLVLMMALAGMSTIAARASAQLRPYDPITWEMYETPATVSVRAGAGALWGQRIALLGTEGTLLEMGVFRASWRSGPIVLEAAGTPWRVYREGDRFAPEQEEVEPDADGDRSDSGDYLVSTTVRLTNDRAPLLAALRFGTRLPTTNNRVGLERDQTDFFAMVGSRWQNRQVGLGAELGVGLHGTRNPAFEQSDVLTYAVELRLKALPLAPELSLVGHADALADRAIRGNEELAEARVRVRTGGIRWIELQLARGLTPFSPGLGVALSGGFTH